MSKKAKCILHADFETPGVISDWMKIKEFSLEVIEPFKGGQLTNHDYDLLILMGGPQSPLQIEKYPYLKDEIHFVKEAITHSKTIIGFCLGAQIIGEALGAQTERSPHREIGVFPIQLTNDGKSDPLFSGFPERFDVIHWHSDMPGLTPECKILASNNGCPRQIVKYKNNIYGFQCHLEITQSGILDLIEACPNDLEPGTYIQNKETLLQKDYKSINKYISTILDRLVGATGFEPVTSAV
jgi:GMP synthase (glutamine-hydrolysing)